MGNSPRPFSTSSILQSSIGNLLRTDPSPHKVAQRNEHKPGDSRDQRDAQARYPPRRNQQGGEPRKSESRTPRPSRSKPHQRFFQLRGSATKRKVRDKNHLPDKNSPKKRTTQHIDITFDETPMIQEDAPE